MPECLSLWTPEPAWVPTLVRGPSCVSGWLLMLLPGSGTVEKCIRITDYLLGTMAGGAADCSFWERQLGFQVSVNTGIHRDPEIMRTHQARVWELREGRRITTAAASKLLCNNVYSYRGRGLSMVRGLRSDAVIGVHRSFLR